MAPKPKDERDPSETCSASKKDGDPCMAYPLEDSDKCRVHAGTNADGSSHKNNANGTSHWLHSSAETFFANADDGHVDTYYAMHESLCSRYEALHGTLPEHIKKDLAEIAFEMAKLDLAKEYEAENAVDPEKPLTEEYTIGYDEERGKPVTVEQVSKVESLKTDIRRENRLALKDMGIYRSPEKQQAEADKSLAAVIAKNADN